MYISSRAFQLGIENCKAEAIGDDCINLQGVYYKVFEKISPTELIVARTPQNDGPNPVWHFISGNPWTDKDQPQLKKLKSWAYQGKAKVLSKEPLTYTVPKERKMHKWAASQPQRLGPGMAVDAKPPSCNGGTG